MNSDHLPDEDAKSPPAFQPPLAVRWWIFVTVIVLFVIISLCVAGPVGLIIVPLGLAAGWVEACHRLFGQGAVYFFVVRVAPVFLIGTGLVLFVGARRLGTWLVGCALLALLLFLPVAGCAKMGPFIDG